MDASSRGPAQRRYTATVNAARHAGDLEALDVLQDALAQARRSAIDMHTPQDAERASPRLRWRCSRPGRKHRTIPRGAPGYLNC